MQSEPTIAASIPIARSGGIVQPCCGLFAFNELVDLYDDADISVM